MKITAEFHQDSELYRFLKKLDGPAMRHAAALGLNEHADEQRRQSVVRISSTTGVPAGRIRSNTKFIKAKPAPQMSAFVETADIALWLRQPGLGSNSQTDGRRKSRRRCGQ